MGLGLSSSKAEVRGRPSRTRTASSKGRPCAHRCNTNTTTPRVRGSAPSSRFPIRPPTPTIRCRRTCAVRGCWGPTGSPLRVGAACRRCAAEERGAGLGPPGAASRPVAEGGSSRRIGGENFHWGLSGGVRGGGGTDALERGDGGVGSEGGGGVG